MLASANVEGDPLLFIAILKTCEIIVPRRDSRRSEFSPVRRTYWGVSFRSLWNFSEEELWEFLGAKVNLRSRTKTIFRLLALSKWHFWFLAFRKKFRGVLFAKKEEKTFHRFVRIAKLVFQTGSQSVRFCVDIRCIDGSPTHTRYTCYDSSPRWAKVRWPHFLPTRLGPQVTIKWLSPANRLPCSPFFRGLVEGSPSVIALVSYLAAPADRVTPRRFRATSRTGDVVVLVGCGGNGCVNTRLERTRGASCF